MDNKQVTLLATSLAHFFHSFTSSAISIALPAISIDFQADAIVLGWINTSILLATGVFLIPFGKISDMLGIKKIFLIGMVLFTISSAIAAMSVSAEMLLVLRVVQGIAGAMVYGNIMALVTRVFPREERGKALGICNASVYVGMSMGPFLGGLLTQHLGWRSLFFLNVPAGLIVILIVVWKMKGDWSERRQEKFDLSGSIIYGVAITLLMYGFSILTSLSGVVLVLAGVLGILVFIRWENKAKNPVLDISMFKNNRVFALSNLSSLLSYSATYAVVFLLSLYLQYIKGLTPDTAGLVMLIKSVMQAVLTPLSGRLSDKIEPRIVASFGMALGSLGLFLMFIFLNDTTPIPLIIVFLFIVGSGFGMFISPNTNAIMSSVKSKNYGLASATLSTMRATGQIFSMGITMVLFAMYMGPVIITPEYYPAFMTSTKIAFGIFAVLCFVGIFASLARGKTGVADIPQDKPDINHRRE